MSTNDQRHDATPAEIDAGATAAAITEALRLLVVGLADVTPQRDASLAAMIATLLEAGPQATGHVLGAVMGYTVTALTAQYGTREKATEFLLYALTQAHGRPLLCPADHIPCPNGQQCVMAQTCRRPTPTLEVSDSAASSAMPNHEPTA